MELRSRINKWGKNLRHPIRAIRAMREARRAIRDKYSPDHALFEIEQQAQREDWQRDDFKVFMKGGGILFVGCVLFRIGVMIVQGLG